MKQWYAFLFSLMRASSFKAIYEKKSNRSQPHYGSVYIKPSSKADHVL